MKQGTLTFQSVKRTNSTTDGKPQRKTAATDKEKRKRLETQTEARNDSQPGEVVEISSDEQSDTGLEITVPAKRVRASAKARLSPGTEKRPASQQSSSETKQFQVGIARKRLDTGDKASLYRRYYNETRSKMGYLNPIHSEGQNKIHQMLRVFDMSYEYGPCIGMTRLERWERAEALGLDPPVEVRDILFTKEGAEQAEYVQCVLHGEV